MSSVFGKLEGLVSSAKHGLESVGDKLSAVAHINDPLTPEELQKIDALFRAANYLTIGSERGDNDMGVTVV